MRITIYKRQGKKGVRWYLDYFWGGQRRRYPVADTKGSAEEIKARIQIQVAEGTFKGPQTHETRQEATVWTFGRLCNEWLRVRKPRIAKATAVFYEEIIDGLKERLGTDCHIVQITVRDCQRILAEKRAESESPVRANRYLTVLRSLFRAAVEWELIERDPTAKLRPEKEPLHERVLDEDEVWQIADAADPQARPAILSLYYTGARRSDLVGGVYGSRPLMWDEVDLDARRITFRDTKEKEPRHVPISEKLQRILKNLSSRFQGGAVFVDGAGEPLRPDYLYRAFKRAAKSAKIKNAKTLRLHDLRHSFASGLVESGVSLYVVQKLLGHKSPRMTQRYAHLQDEVLQKAVEKLGGTPVAQGT